MLPVRNARRTSCPIPNVPRSRISERAPFRIYEHGQCQVFERTSLHRAYVIPCRQQMGSSAVLRTCRSAFVLAASTRCLRQAHSIGRGCRVHTCVMAIGADFRTYLLRQFCLNQVEFFYNTQETQMQKMMDQNVEIRIFFKFSKRRRAVPLRPI